MIEESAERNMPAHAPNGLAYALQWSQLPVEHLQIALKAIEPELKREHELRMQQDAHVQELQLERLRLESAQQQFAEQLQHEERQAKRSHTLYLMGLFAGFLISGGTLGGAIYVGIHDQPWLASLLAGPTLLALATLFVLRKNDKTLNTAADQSNRRALNAAQQQQQQPTSLPPVGGSVV
ncbi:hypothetical protein ACFW7J_26420 [Streptomyces sp. NPDC059525]|uniref:hypothetical protein n=1 Tax=Streptomyces sp. NPDC059525 TaxID=3346857 RepID=UPI003681DBDE